MSRAAPWLLAAGAVLFILILASHDFVAVLKLVALTGWGLLAVALFHLLPLVLDAAAMRVLFAAGRARAMVDALLVRWIGESANSLMPAGMIGGPLLMIRQLTQRGTPPAEAVAAITISTTLQSLAQILFALLGVALVGARAAHLPARGGAWVAVLVGAAVLVVMPVAFYLLQRRGLFAGVAQLAQRFAHARDWSDLVRRAEDIDRALGETYRQRARVWMSFLLNLIGWLVGTGEVWLALRLLGSPVSWSDALLLESLGQAVRSAAFAIPASLGVQEGGYLLLAPLVGLRPDVALGLSLVKRARELLLAIPGLIYLHFCERAFRRSPAPAASD
jgi:putative membrane protein